MRCISIVIFFIVFSHTISYGQKSSYQQLIDTAIKFSGHFIYSRPITIVNFDKEQMLSYWQVMKDTWKNPIDTLIILEIIDNNKSIDSTEWTDAELKKYLLVKSDSITLKYIIKKLKLNNQSEIAFYKELLNKFYDPKVCNKGICRFSRPMFDRSKKYAIIQYDIRDCYNEGNGSLKLLMNTKNGWSEIGNILEWRVRLAG